MDTISGEKVERERYGSITDVKKRKFRDVGYYGRDTGGPIAKKHLRESKEQVKQDKEGGVSYEKYIVDKTGKHSKHPYVRQE